MKLYANDTIKVYEGDSNDVLKLLEDNSIDSIVTDPPYALVSIQKRFGKTSLDDDTKTSEMARDRSNPYARASKGFMSKNWDTGKTAFAVEFWEQCSRVLKPGGHVLAFGATRSYHKLACAIEDAGFEIRDCIMWLYGSGMPKGHQIKGFDGWNTALKPACEPIVVARKPLSEKTIVNNVLKYGTGGINIDGCRIEASQIDIEAARVPQPEFNSETGKTYNMKTGEGRNGEIFDMSKGRWPANVILDGSDEVINKFPNTKSGDPGIRRKEHKSNSMGKMNITGKPETGYGDSGSASRFFYHAKANKNEKIGDHPTQKPISLMQYLCRLVTPKGGIVLDPFAGTGTTAEASWREGFNCILIERENEYVQLIDERMNTMHTRYEKTTSLDI